MAKKLQFWRHAQLMHCTWHAMSNTLFETPIQHVDFVAIFEPHQANAHGTQCPVSLLSIWLTPEENEYD